MTPASHHIYPIQMLFIFNNESISNADANQSFLLSYFLKIVLSFKYDKLKLGFALRYQDSGALQNSHHGSALNCIFCFIFPLHSTIWSALHVHIYYTFQMSKWYFTNIFQKIFSEYYTPLHTLQPTPVQHQLCHCNGEDRLHANFHSLTTSVLQLSAPILPTFSSPCPVPG